MNNYLYIRIYFTMKKIIKFLLPTILFILLLITPSIVKKGAINGLSIWFDALIPALLPYMLFSNIVINAQLTTGMTKLALPITRLLKISPNAAYGIIAGLFFGYPACAANLSLLIKNKQLDKEAACFCACAFNNVSPAYLIGFVCIGLLGNTSHIIPIIILFYISLLLSTILIKILFFKQLKPTPCNNPISTPRKKGLINSAIKNSLINIGLLGGYVIIFSIITEYIKSIPISALTYTTPFIEVAGGSMALCNSSLSYKELIIILLPAQSFGGISGIFQTLAVDTEGFIDIKKYIYSKLLSGIICLIITALTVYVLKIPI